MSDKPNIIYIMADDMGYGDLSCFGATKIQTPNMDRIAAEGIKMTDAHSSSAVCTPSRYSVLTGRYCWRTRLQRWVLWGFEPPLIEENRPTVATMLKHAGYATAAIGKWHVGLGWSTSDGKIPEADGANVDYSERIWGGPVDHGFETSYCITGSLDMAPYVFIQDDHCDGIPDRPKATIYPQQRPGLQTPEWDDEQVDVTFANKAAQFIDAHTAEDPDQPFFLYLTPSAPHRPCVPPDFMRGASQAGLRGDMVCLVDWMVGQVDAALERNGLRENTLIMVTGDNGARAVNYDGKDYGHKSCGVLRGQKADIWDGGHREAFVARWPGHIAPGSESDALICLMDVMATCAQAAGVELPDDAAEDSFSFLPAMTGCEHSGPERTDLIHHSGNGMFSYRQGEKKLIMGLGSGGFSDPVFEIPEPGDPMGQLYDMNADISETNNLWLSEPEAVARMSAELERFRYQGYSRPGVVEPRWIK